MWVSEPPPEDREGVGVRPWGLLHSVSHPRALSVPETQPTLLPFSRD